jgi:hypothetical protein
MVGSTCAAALLSMAVVAAQTTSQQPTQSPIQGSSQQTPAQRGQSDAQPAPPLSTAANANKEVTVTGCVMREGTSDFVLSSASTTGGSATVSAGVSGSTSSGAVGTTGTTSSPDSTASATTSAKSGRYMLSGGKDLASYVGQRVEIVGKVDTSAVGTSGSTTPGVTARAGTSDHGASASASATDRTATPHLDVSSVKAVSGACP